MKFSICLLICLTVGGYNHVYGSPTTLSPSTEEKLSEKTESTKSDETLIGKNNNEQDTLSAAIRIPVDNANKLLYDLDAQVRQLFDDSSILPVKEEKSEDGETIEDIQTYSAANRELDIYPRQTDTQQQASLIMQLENLEKHLLTTINELQTRRRYFSSTMLRQMYNSVHRIRINIGRIQNQFTSTQQTGGLAGIGSSTKPGQLGVMQNLQQRVTDLQKAVNDIINRVTSTFQGPNASKPTGHQVLQAVNF